MSSIVMFGSLLCALFSAFAAGTSLSQKTILTSYLDGNTDIVRASFFNPPINLVDVNVIDDLYDLLTELNASASRPKVVIFSKPRPGNSTAIINRYAEVLRLLSILPMIFLGESNGLTTSAGNEVFLHMDMRFAGPQATFGGIEAGVGLLHVGGFRQLSHLIGAGRAAQYLLTSLNADARTASRIGWVNDMFEDAGTLRRNSNDLARRMALFPAGGLAATKQAIHDTDIGTSEQPFEIQLFNHVVNSSIAQYALARYLTLSRNGTDRLFEAGRPESLAQIWEK
ncbi:Short-chain-enoyl-CoA hydratase-like protein [Cladobotryum mycophilum]|uniref:Short-chain-enoyl-CoA hydratase-like protein n=1 Tax=Cladobotryum mycophilum TaxID=491253 RepID=A0ABR0SSD8_9HYPO